MPYIPSHTTFISIFGILSDCEVLECIQSLINTVQAYMIFGFNELLMLVGYADMAQLPLTFENIQLYCNL